MRFAWKYFFYFHKLSSLNMLLFSVKLTVNLSVWRLWRYVWQWTYSYIPCNLWSTWRWEVRFTLRPHYPRGKIFPHPQNKRLVGPLVWSKCFGKDKNSYPYRDWNRVSPAVQPLACIPYRLPAYFSLRMYLLQVTLPTSRLLRWLLDFLENV